MSNDDEPDVSSMEIKALLSKLDPKKGGKHSDRVKRMERFMKYVKGSAVGGKKHTPEFYDDDMPLLMLGSQSPTAMYDEELLNWNLYGLVQACGTPSVEHEKMLKRSARNAMTLLKYLTVDHVEYNMGKKIGATSLSDDLNGFAHALCCCTVKQLRQMNLDLHVHGDKRGGAKEDACHVLVLVICRHLGEDGETPQPLAVEDLLATSGARKEFDAWLKTQDKMRSAVRKAVGARNAERKEKRKAKASDKAKKQEEKTRDEFGMDDEGNEAKEEGGPPTKWEDSELCQSMVAMNGEGDAVDGRVREAELAAAAERNRVEEEKLKVLCRDPLGIRPKDFDLRQVADQTEELLEEAIKEVDEQIEEERKKSDGDPTHIQNLEQQKKAIESLDASGKSIMPTDPNFDPLLFLTLVHRNASFPELQKSITRLSNKTDSHVTQLQKLVRDNFALFIRCADGMDKFTADSAKEQVGVADRLNTLDALSESCSFQAKKSFKPLIDNTTEVRKVQSALAVLQRVQPILEAPIQMRQHLENGRFSAAVKAYRRVLVVDDTCKIDLLQIAKSRAAECAREARRDLEATLADRKVPAPSLLQSIRHLDELLELAVPPDPKETATVGKEITASESPSKEDKSRKHSKTTLIPAPEMGIYEVGSSVINIREHPPSTACLLLQTAHFSSVVQNAIEHTENSMQRIFEGESLSDVHTGVAAERSGTEGTSQGDDNGNRTSAGKRWKFDVLDARVIATIRAVTLARDWIPRLLHIGTAAYDAEKRRAARLARRGIGAPEQKNEFRNALTAFETFITNVSPSVGKLVEHATFCALGSSHQNTDKDIKMSFGKQADEKLQAVLRAPLPSSQSTKCAKELAELGEVVTHCAQSVSGLKSMVDSSEDSSRLSRLAARTPLEVCTQRAEEAVIAVEKRRCIYAFDVCARNCAMRASASGVFDGDAFMACVRKLSEELTRPEECSQEVANGCELVVQHSCEGLASFVRDRGDPSRLRAVAECANAVNKKLVEVIKEVTFLTDGRCKDLGEVLNEEMAALESSMFADYLENVRETAANCSKLGKSKREKKTASDGEKEKTPTFPSYLSASLLAIVRCRAQVERALGETTVRRSEGVTYQFLAMATASDTIVDCLCTGLKEKMPRLRGRKADRYANELQFLQNTLKNYLSDEMMSMAENCRRLLTAKSGKGSRSQGDGPDGLAVLEELERLGRVYVLCLGE